MKATFGIAIIGTGIMGGRMLAALAQQQRFRVVSMFDVDREALDAMVGKVAGAKAAASVDALVNDPAVDIVYIATPPATHRLYVEAALAAGRACLCEKPLAADVDDAQVVRDGVVRAALPFAINFPLASAPASRNLLALVRDGSLGEILSASIMTRFAQWPRPWQVGASAWLAGAVEGGFTREVLSHFVFLAQRLFGPAQVTDVQLTREAGHAETALRARLLHAKLSVTIDAAVAGEIADTNRFEIVGTKGSAALVDWSRLEFNGRISDRVDATPGTLDRLALMLEGRADHELATVDEGLAVVRCIEAMLRS